MVDYRPLLFLNALALMLLVTAGFASIQRDAGHLPPPLAGEQPQHQAPPPGQGPSQDIPAPQPSPAGESVFADADREPGNTPDDPAPEQGPTGNDGSTGAPTASATSFSIEPIPTAESVKADTGTAPQLAMAEPATPKPQPAVPDPAPEPTTARLTLRSNVLGDTVEINGKPYGSTRLDLELDPGDYEIVITKPGYKPWSETVRVAAGDDLTLHGNLTAYTRVEYHDGTWVGGIRTGDGTYEGSDGLQYHGHFVDGQFDGEGVALYPDGSRYEGDWKAGQRAGEGTYRAPDGATYTGHFEGDDFNGQGTLTRANGDVLTGQWSDGRLNGHGSLTGADGTLYVGGFKDGKFHGEGTLTYPNGHHYEGGFSNGEFNGEGNEIFADGKKYVGQYMEGEFHGKGTLMNPNGSSIEGTFRYGEPYGQAKLTTPEGEVFSARTSEPGVCYRDKSYRATQCPPLEGW
ncbi:PEGA domain-containing protein [Marinobacter halodurans]|uniref:PEGA domain-containing protein n=1 Tax=Marinobacter halodurans TaxID=2528979 RepID=A0ABY1ZEL1_9GAMM|nr:PEGA domain-containing protein [Marinobacter halodurans]TBW48625.1 PEGA domain-containing protein [Marinobacter halodurans]